MTADELLIKRTLTKASFDISDLVNSYPYGPQRVMLLACMLLVVTNARSRFSKSEEVVFSDIVEHTTTAFLPAEADPRRKDR